MGRYEFKVVVSGVELSEEQQKHIGQSISQAGATAVAGFSRGGPISVPVDLNHLWIGIPVPELLHDLEGFAQKQVAEG
ncbi:MAG TPA: hypothetical protein VHS55_02280 [Solirubrobacteraceae bacterium]|nr:hypothetical protein [Solirubrobacteraceae bacterium]